MGDIGNLAHYMNEQERMFFLVNQYKNMSNSKKLTEHADALLEKWSEDILTNLIAAKHNLSIDDILTTLSILGYAPNLLYDDNGMWALSFDGMQEVVYGDEPIDLSMSFYVEKKQWQKTIREANDYALGHWYDED